MNATPIPLRKPTERRPRRAEGEPRLTREEKRQRQIDQRRQQIFAAALACFERHGYHQTSISNIAEAAGISPGLIYQYFADKKDLLFQVILEILEAYNREIPLALVGVEHPLERVQVASIAYCKVIRSRVAATHFAYRETKSLEPAQIETLKAKELQTNELVGGCFARCIADGFFRQTNVELATYRVLTVAHMWALKHWRLAAISTFEDYVRENLKLIFESLLTEKGRADMAGRDLLDGRPL